MNNNICRDYDVRMIVIVSSAVQNKEYRDVIRSSWGRPDIPTVKTSLAFMVGLPQEHEQQQELERENNLHHDLVQGNILDTYHNLTFKSVMGHLWVSEFCRQAEVVVKADDDIYLDLYGIYTVAARYFQDQRYRDNMFMMGMVNRLRLTEVIRSAAHPWSKWLVSYSEYPRDEEKFPGNSTEYYPEYIVGWLLVTNPGTSARVVQQAQTMPYLYIEDVWVTGILREKIGIVPIDMYGLRAHSVEDLLMAKTFQSTETYLTDYVTSISFPREVEKYRVCQLLEEEARRCYLTKCKSNLYQQDVWVSQRDLERGLRIKNVLEKTGGDLEETFLSCAKSSAVREQRRCRRTFINNFLKFAT